MRVYQLTGNGENTLKHILSRSAETYLKKLCLELPGRVVGSQGNRMATEFFADVTASFGFQIQSSWFDCFDWHSERIQLTANGYSFKAFASPYTPGCRVEAPLAVVSTPAELETADLSGKIVLLFGEIAREQLMPKNFPFYNPEEHQRIIQLLEAAKPQAIIAATSQDRMMAGGISPFPLIEDGDFDIPSCYMSEEEGKRLAQYIGQQVTLEIRAERIPAQGCNVTARKGNRADRRIVFCAHIDAKRGSPGAIDNAAGVAALLLLAELLADYHGDLGIELLAINGEDYYSNPGEQRFLTDNAGHFNEIILGVNLDGAGYRKGKTAFSLYGCSDNLSALIREIFSHYNNLIEGEHWYQGDHALFVMNGISALAFTSEKVTELMSQFVHTPQDQPQIVDADRLVEIALALHDLVMRLDRYQN